MKALLVTLLCIYSGIDPEAEKTAVGKTLVGKSPTPPDISIQARNPTGIYRYGSGVTNPIPIIQTTPRYTKAALREQITGTIWLQAIIRKNGRVDSFKVIRGLGHGLEEQSMKEIATHWRFKPGMLDGEPVDVLATIEVEFNLRDRAQIPMRFRQADGRSRLMSPLVETSVAAPKKSSNRYTNPVPLVHTNPKYPKEALRKRISGTVQLAGIIRKDGSVSIVQVIRYPDGGESLIRTSMTEVTQKWKYKPAMLDGEPIEATVTIDVEFSLRR